MRKTGGDIGTVLTNVGNLAKLINGDVLTYYNGKWVNSAIPAVPGGVDVDATYIDGDGTPLSPLDLKDSGVTPASYTWPQINVDVKGRITSAFNGSTPLLAVTTTARLTGDGKVGTPLELGTSGVVPGTYTNATVTVDTYGRTTSASSASPSPLTAVTTNVSLTGDGTPGDPLSMPTSILFPTFTGKAYRGYAISYNMYGTPVLLQPNPVTWDSRWVQTMTINTTSETVVLANNIDTNFTNELSGNLNVGNGRWTSPVGQTTMMSASCWMDYNASATGFRVVSCFSNTSGVSREYGRSSQDGSATAGANSVNMKCDIVLNPGTWVEFRVYQNSGSNMTGQKVHCSMLPLSFSN